MASANPLSRSAATSPADVARRPTRRWRTWWLKQLHSWHWISAAVAMIVMLLFAVTGITLNHAASIGATPVVVQRHGVVPLALRPQLAGPHAKDAALPAGVAAAVRGAVALDASGRAGEWSDGEVYVALPRPGGDAWVSIDRTSGAISAEVTNRGWVSWLNDLHKGRNTGPVWFWFIDVFAAACILFTLTGLLLLWLHAGRRPLTWPLVGLGLVVPVTVAILFIH